MLEGDTTSTQLKNVFGVWGLLKKHTGGVREGEERPPVWVRAQRSPLPSQGEGCCSTGRNGRWKINTFFFSEILKKEKEKKNIIQLP